MKRTANRAAAAPSSHAAHLAELRQRYDHALETHGFDAVVIGAGSQLPVFGDDQHYPFRAHPWFVQWAPLTRHPDACIVYRPGRAPVLLLVEPEDYWDRPAALPGGDWAEGLPPQRCTSLAQLHRRLPRRRVAILAPPEQAKQLAIVGSRLNPPALLKHLAYDRAIKTAWEVAQIRLATRLALKGHAAAGTAFKAGGSEHEISHAFLSASGQSDDELPYPTIVALNEHAATLHYRHRDRRRLPRRERHSLLIDAGCSSAGYASDITRTWAARRGPFARLVAAMDEAQQRLCALVRPGIAFGELQLAAHDEVATLLEDSGIVRLPAAQLCEERITDLFFPHGLGHYLGLQVHDIGGNLVDRKGSEGTPPARFPRMRLNRTLAPGQVLTVEPGLYFIEPLLRKLRQHRRARRVDWGLVEALRPCGGIRIEDNVLVTPDGAANLTRSA
ncbi:MAG: Xaa-Pro dipeptidase [Chromatiales bacterium]|nr:Xaa-Pro dipeptidase [Chromatiales bacterium]